MKVLTGAIHQAQAWVEIISIVKRVTSPIKKYIVNTHGQWFTIYGPKTCTLEVKAMQAYLQVFQGQYSTTVQPGTLLQNKPKLSLTV